MRILGKIVSAVGALMLLSGCVTTLRGNAVEAYQTYQESRSYHPFKAFAYDNASGSWGRAWGRFTPDAAAESAVAWCRTYGSSGCQVYAIGDTVVSGLTESELNNVISEYVDSVRAAWNINTPTGETMTGNEIDATLTGRQLLGETFYAFELEVSVESDGTMIQTMRASDDLESIVRPWGTSSWWIDGDHFCYRTDSEPPNPIMCLEVLADGETFYFINSYGIAVGRFVLAENPLR